MQRDRTRVLANTTSNPSCLYCHLLRPEQGKTERHQGSRPSFPCFFPNTSFQNHRKREKKREPGEKNWKNWGGIGPEKPEKKKNEKHRGAEKPKPRKRRKNTQSKNRDKRKHKTQKTNDWHHRLLDRPPANRKQERKEEEKGIEENRISVSSPALVSKRKQKKRSRKHWISFGHSPFTFSLGSLATGIGPGERMEGRKATLPIVVQTPTALNLVFTFRSSRPQVSFSSSLPALHYPWTLAVRLISLFQCTHAWCVPLPSRVTGLGQWPGWAGWVQSSPCGLSWAQPKKFKRK